ncbi:MAG: hypothetical protein HY929_04930 [Euryarchaeota archaeon]|nr:hypothetical protein [Euryarchaeota archaeon]
MALLFFISSSVAFEISSYAMDWYSFFLSDLHYNSTHIYNDTRVYNFILVHDSFKSSDGTWLETWYRIPELATFVFVTDYGRMLSVEVVQGFCLDRFGVYKNT